MNTLMEKSGTQPGVGCYLLQLLPECAASKSEVGNHTKKGLQLPYNFLPQYAMMEVINEGNDIMTLSKSRLSKPANIWGGALGHVMQCIH
jgi:hypothetical protein